MEGLLFAIIVIAFIFAMIYVFYAAFDMSRKERLRKAAAKRKRRNIQIPKRSRSIRNCM